MQTRRRASSPEAHVAQLSPAEVPSQQARALVPHAWQHLVMADFAFLPICDQKIFLLSHCFLKLSFFPHKSAEIKLPLDILFLFF